MSPVLKVNVWNQPTKLLERQDALSKLVSSISTKDKFISAVLVSSQSLISSIPSLYALASSNLGTVVHVPADGADEEQKGFSNFTLVMSVGQCGLSFLASSSVQEAYDFVLISHITSLRTGTSMLHFFDNRRVFDEFRTIQVMSNEILLEFEQNVMGKKTDYPQDIVSVLSEVMHDFGELTGRKYLPWSYSGHSKAESIVVLMGAGAIVAEEVVSTMLTQNPDAKIGVLKISLYRPWSSRALLNILPRSIKRVATLEPIDNDTTSWNPLFLDVASMYQDADVDLFSGQYGIDDLDFSAEMVQAVFDHLETNTLDRHFKVSQLQLTSDHLVCVPDFVEQSIFVGSESLALVYAGSKERAQVYTADGLSYVRLDLEQNHPFLIHDASVVVIPSLINQSQSVEDAIGALVKGGSVIFGFSDSHTVPASIKRLIYVKEVNVVFIQELSEVVSQGTRLSHILLNYKTFLIPSDWNHVPAVEVEFDKSACIAVPEVFRHAPLETPHLEMLDQVFGERLEVANAIQAASIWSSPENHPNAATPEFGYGRLIHGIQEHSRLVSSVVDIIQSDRLPLDVVKVLSQWLLLVHSPKAYDSKVINTAGELAVQVLEALVNTHYGPIVESLLIRRNSFATKSNWLIGSDAWSRDLGLSGIHHVITSGENINLLVVDTTCYSTYQEEEEQRKKDIGLFAMNYGSVYVASVALYSSYTGVLQALIEADAYRGPSIVIAYLPQKGASPDPLESLKETKICVDNGKWPLYRWNPALDESKVFTLDSQCIKRELEEFLKRENHLSLLSSAQPDLKLVSSLEHDMKQRHSEMKQKARLDYARLLSGISDSNGPPLTVLFGSDNGNAETLAKKVSARAKSRGLKVKLAAMDDYDGDIKDLASETNLVVICSTAGQGEMPSNSREFWKSLNGLEAGIFSDLSVSVLGLGDSHYWPRKEDIVFYNRPGKLLDAKFEALGASRLTPLGLCDDQDEDGFETGYNVWLPELWKSLGIRGDGDEEEPVYTDNQMKLDSNFLRGDISQELIDNSTGGVSETTQKLMKFHGCYVQDDRDIRDERKKQGLEKAFSFLIRIRTPGGVSTPQQWLMFDELSEKYGNKTMKLTTRQAYQLHGVLKKDLRTTIKGINKSLLTTLATCGDVNRNIMSTAITEIPEIHGQVQSIVEELKDLLAPKTNAYHEIWLDDKLVAGHAVQDQEPLYSPAYLPRKFKIVIAVPPNNDVDVYAHDLGLIAIVDKVKKSVVGYNVLIGGGMGQTHGNKKTYPRPASLVGFIPTESILAISQAIVEVQRDHGDRLNRKHARFKYTIDDLGLDFVKKEIETRSGIIFEEARPFVFESNLDRYGWSRGINNTWNFGMFIENGRVKDTPDFLCKTGLRELAKFHKGEFRLTANQHLVISNVPEEDLEKTKAHLAKYNLDNLAFSGLRKSAMACVALPTCSLAMAESERYLPKLVILLEDTMEQAGLANDSIVFRMTGCPNGCARPYLAEIALVGKAPSTYNLYLGGSPLGSRLNKIYKENLQEETILNELKPMIKTYALERNQDEPFGDWVIRAGYVKKTTTGMDFHTI
ncbi:thiamine diphosphate-binding protein [Backusella circina FSU 941]|nr:thiamine diphosphate-binding protein [Backusella circina FSU 941]